MNPSRPATTLLVAMQEHHKEVHHVAPDVFGSAVRISLLERAVECYVWAFPPAVVSQFTLPHASYLRAIKRPQDDLRPKGSPTLAVPKELIFTYDDGRYPAPVGQCIDLVREDPHAWYGYPAGASREGLLLIWPKDVWDSADENEER